MLAIIYEPRGRSRRGRMAYVGWAILHGSPRRDLSGQGNAYRVDFLEPIRSFDRPVPREIDGEPIEQWLRDYPRGNLRNTATRGRAVRGLVADEVETIIRLGATNGTWNAPESTGGDPSISQAGDTRTRQIVTRLGRSERFRQDVLEAYGKRCAVSGLSAGRIKGLVEAAHIRGAGQPECGPDHITNGIALTPTLHRLFDRHLFSLQYQGNELVVVTSNQLTIDMVQDPITGSRLSLQQGQRVCLPSDIASRPGRQFVDFHRRLLLS